MNNPISLPVSVLGNPFAKRASKLSNGSLFACLRIVILAYLGSLALNTSGKETLDASSEPASERWEYIENGQIRLGVDKARGGCIGFFGDARTERNLLNHYDHGRFIQQSYYGDPDGSDWNEKPWRYNPIQGGSWRGKDARVLDFRIDQGVSLYSKVEPRHWATGKRCPEAIMEQWVNLDGPVAHVRCKMTYTGHDHERKRSQEMPAVFVDADLKHLVYIQNQTLIRRLPGWPNEPGKTSEDWVAYVDDEDRGIGILTPGTPEFTCYRYKGDGKSGSDGSACSYVAPIRKLRLQRDQVVEYEFYLTLGTLEEIRQRFAALRQKEQQADKTPEKRPNIIMVFTDDWGYGDLGVLQNLTDVKTPNLDRLADLGVLFTDAYITAPQCSPSRAGLVVGRYQQRFGFDAIPDCPLPLDQSTIADRFKTQGYATGMVGKWHLDPNRLSVKWAKEHQPDGIRGKRVQVQRDLSMSYFPQARGFDDFFMGQRARYWCNFNVAGEDLMPEGEFIEDARFRVDVQTEASLAFIRRNQSQPFFLYLAYFAPHVPLEAPPKYLDRFSSEMPERRRTGLAMINAVDEGIGRIMSLLTEQGIAENTFIMFTSDNGAPLGAHTGEVMADILPVNKPGPAWDGSRNDPLAGEKGMLAEGGIRVPMIWSWPAHLPKGTTVAAPVISLDMTATSLAAAGTRDLALLDGIDLLPYLTGKAEKLPERSLYWRFWNQAAIRSGNWKYLLTGSGQELLFNLQTDKEEQNNLLNQQQDLAAKMRSDLRQWTNQLRPRGLPSDNPNGQEQRWYQHYFQNADQ